MDSAVNIIIVGPVLVNVMAQAGFPEVQAAIVVIVGFLIGSVTPPVGVALLYSCNNSTSAFRKGGSCVNSLSSWAVFTFIFYP